MKRWRGYASYFLLASGLSSLVPDVGIVRCSISVALVAIAIEWMIRDALDRFARRVVTNLRRKMGE